MVNHKEILRLKSLGLAHQEITASCGCGRNTVTRTLARAREQNLSWDMAKGMSPQQVTAALFPSEKAAPVYKMPDYEWVHREMQKSGVTLPYSQYTYVEPCLDMKENSWLLCNVHMFEFWGGTTTRIVCDNLKTGVVSHPKEGEIVLNEAYEALGNHYMTAIMPAQVHKPKQKASVEGAVGKIATAVIARLRNEEFHSIDELRSAVVIALDEFNREPFQKREGSPIHPESPALPGQ